ncbi:MAG: AMP-binding protein [Myxococcales bacterium]|nr:MAG: AMP-binding protein [Myxococcales bacterium]
MSPKHWNNLGEALRDSIITYKDSLALCEMNRKRQVRALSYLDVAKEAARVLAFLKSQHVDSNDRVAIVMSNQSNWLIGAYAIFLRGAVLVPIDYKLSAQEQAALLQHSGVKLVLSEYAVWQKLHQCTTLAALVSELPDQAFIANTVRWEHLPAAELDFKTCSTAGRDDLATIVYSSGTGGTPKGCMLSHGNYLAQYASLNVLFPLGEGDRYFSILPTNHAIDFMCGFLGPFFGGATVVHQRALRPEFILDTMQKKRITHMAVVPLLLEAFERAIREKIQASPTYKQKLLSTLSAVNRWCTQRSPNHALSKRLIAPIHEAFGGELKVLFCGGAMVDQKRAEFFYRLGIPVAIGYGLTEACTVLTVNDLRPFRGDSVGKPVPGTELKLAHQNADGVGEVWVRGDTVMLGYLDAPELSAAVFEDGWLKTGDLGAIDSAGHLRLLGRSKNMIVTAGGKNVYPEDVESAFEDLPCEELAVMASNYLWQKEQLEHNSLVAVVRSEQDRQSVIDGLKQKNQSLPDYKRLQGVLFWPEHFPRTASLKLKRESLAAMLREQSSSEEMMALR